MEMGETTHLALEPGEIITLKDALVRGDGGIRQ